MKCLSNLKPGWTRVKFGDVVRLSKTRSSDPLKDGYERYIGLEHIEPEDLRIRRWGNVADGVTFTSVFKPGQVLFGKRRAYQRKVAVADFSGVCSGDIYVFESNDQKVLLPELLQFICQTEEFFQHAVGTSAGSLSPRTNWTSLRAFDFVLPPLELQRQFANALYASDQVRQELEDAATKGTVALESLTAFLLGVEQYEVTTAIIRGEIVYTSNGLPIQQVKSICASDRQGVQVGPFGGSVSSKYFTESGVPVLKINNISKTFSLDMTDQVYVSEAHASKLGNRYRVRPGDLVTAAQATIGRSALISDELSGALISQHLIRVAPDPAVCLPDWLLLCFSSPLVIRQLHSVTQGGTRAGLNTQDVANIRLPVPDLSKQIEIMLIVAAHREAVSKLVSRARTAFELGQRIRRKALGG